jgi:tripartite-type tricarboxylate transporter receptor subunit TctC
MSVVRRHGWIHPVRGWTLAHTQLREITMRCTAFLLVAAGIWAAAGPACASEFPASPVRVVLGYPAGSSADIIIRLLAAGMGERLGQPLVVENRPGAGGTIASAAVARAAPDGQTLLVDGCSATGIVYGYVMRDKPPLDPFRDFVPVGRLMRDHWILAVSPALGVGSLAELVALGKADPKRLSYPSNGLGSGQHLQTERVRIAAGFEALHVPYRDSPYPDLIEGRTSFIVQTSAAIAPMIRSGRIKALAVLSQERMAAFPAIPTIGEAGLPGVVYNAGLCLYAVGGTPHRVVETLNDALAGAQRSEIVMRRFGEIGVETASTSPAQAAAYVRTLMEQTDRLRLRIFGKAR